MGIAPPTILLTNSNPLPDSDGSTVNDDMAVLATTTGLLDVLRFGFGFSADRFSESDLRLADIGFDLEFPEHTVDDDFQVQLAHARQ